MELNLLTVMICSLSFSLSMNRWCMANKCHKSANFQTWIWRHKTCSSVSCGQCTPGRGNIVFFCAPTPGLSLKEKACLALFSPLLAPSVADRLGLAEPTNMEFHAHFFWHLTINDRNLMQTCLVVSCSRLKSVYLTQEITWPVFFP